LTGSISHPDPVTRRAALGRFFVALDGELRAAAAATAEGDVVRHATRAGASPLRAIYLWRGDLATHARLTPSASDRTSRV